MSRLLKFPLSICSVPRWLVPLCAITLSAIGTSRADFTAYVGGFTTPWQFGLAITNQGSFGISNGRTPAAGTPAFHVFNNAGLYLNWNNIQSFYNDGVVAHVLTRLNPNRRYRLQGTAIRGGSYLRRWTLFELGNAQSFISEHTTNCLTSAQVPTLAAHQVAINTGANDTPATGDIFDWRDVQPSEDGVLVIFSRVYTGPIPAGTPEQSAYTLQFLKVQEFGTNLGPVRIISGPQSQSIMRGQPVSFTVQCESFGASIKYQWRKNDAPIPGATAATFTIPAVTDSDAGFFSVVVSNSVSSMTSTNAELQVVEPKSPVITQQPVHQLGFLGENVSFSVEVEPGATVSYQWQFNGENLPGATSRLLSLKPLQPAHEGAYSVLVRNSFGVSTSSDAMLTLTTPGEVLNCDSLAWTSVTNWPRWFPQTQTSHDGYAALQSGPLTRGGEVTKLQTTVQGPCTIKFWLKMNAPDTSARTYFDINKSSKVILTGNVDWQQYVFHLGSNSHTLEWALYSNSSSAPQQVIAWLDEVTFLPGGQAPEILSSVSGQSVLVGAPAAMSVSQCAKISVTT